MSDDGASSVVIIAMLGNVFSPRWARTRRSRPRASSLDFSTMNVSVRSRGDSRWALTEHGASAVTREGSALAIGRSRIENHGGVLVAHLDERCAPWGTPLRGTVRMFPLAEACETYALDHGKLHTWSPRVPVARIEVELEEPRLSFAGTGYLDTNAGETALEETFSSWAWSRVAGKGGRAAIAYDVTMRDGSATRLSLEVDERGELAPRPASPLHPLPPTRFGLARHGRGPAGEPLRIVKTLEDGPFYARSVVATRLGGAPASGMHEMVSLDRFRAPWVQLLVPFKMRVAAG
ncbi:MAG: crtC [Labilithrix sp.]|nr:crtC [Labilithrix sp.]